ncbi:MAG: hypothetical protein R6V04_07885 [bacterium]
MIRLSGLKVPAVIMLLVMGITFMANGIIMGAALSAESSSETLVGKEKPNYEDCAWYNLLCHAKNGFRWLQFYIEEIIEFLLLLDDFIDSVAYI